MSDRQWRNGVRSETDLIALDNKVAWLALQGYPVSYIANELGESHSTVTERLDYLHTEWRRSSQIAIDQHAGQALALAFKNIQLAFESFELSKKAKRKTKITAEKITAQGESRMVPSRQEVTEEESNPGDPRWLMVVDASIKTIIRIVGIEKAAQLTAQFTTNITQINATANPDEINERAAKFARQFGLTPEQYATSVLAGIGAGQSLGAQVSHPDDQAIDVPGTTR